MKILQLCLRVPLPPYDGATIAMYSMADSLSSNGCQVKMLAFNTKKHFVPIDTIDDTLKDKFKLETVYLDASVTITGALKNLFRKNESYNISRFDIPEFHQKIKEILQNESFDIVQFEGLFLSPYLTTVRKYSNAKCILRAHNVEWIIWKRLAQSTGNILKKAYLHFLAQRLRSYENKMINLFDTIVTITEEDQKTFKGEGCKVTTKAIPAGIDTSKFDDTDVIKAESLSVFHLGSMDWLPNIEAIEWFIKKIWPLIAEKSDQIKVFLAGKNMSPEFLNLKIKNIFVEGEIKNSKLFMKNKPVMIVPLLSGGGMRIKILEGLAAGKVIVSTRIGAEGILYEHHKNIIIADTPQQFADAILGLLGNNQRLTEISAQAKLLARKHYDVKELGRETVSFYQSLL